MNSYPLYLIPLLPLIGAFLNGSIALKAARYKTKPTEWLVGFLGTALPAASFLLVLCQAWPFLFHHAETPKIETLATWMSSGAFKVDFALRFDRLSALMCLIITGVGSLIHLYSTSYMKGDAGFARYFAYLNLFLFSMLVLVLGDNLLILFIGWEGVGLCSYLLIGFWFEDQAKAIAGKKAFIVNRIGDFGFLAALFMIAAVFFKAPFDPFTTPSPYSFFSFDFLVQHKEFLAPVAVAITLLLFVGATGKSAQIPLYVWLPDAMAGPTPVSALIHAATMVTAGVYMIARLSFLYDLAPFTRELIATVGAITAIFAATIGLAQRDIKKILAYSTVSQLGYMFVGVGLAGSAAGIFHVMTHAFFKACLFLGSGSVIHAMHGEQDIFKMGGLKKWMPITFATFFISTLAIAGLPPFSGFFSKDEILWQAFSRGYFHLWILGFIGAGLTSFYMFRLVTLTFFGKCRADHHTQEHLHESPISMTLPLLLLAILATVGGFANVPHALGGHSWLHHWLEGEAISGITQVGGFGKQLVEKLEHVFHSEITLERFMAALSVVWAGLCSSLAVWIYLKKPAFPERIAVRFKTIFNLLANKYYIDEIYNGLIVKPLTFFSRLFLWKGVDSGLIDRVGVNGTAEANRFFGRLIGFLQNGVTNSYALYFLLGIVVLFAWQLW